MTNEWVGAPKDRREEDSYEAGYEAGSAHAKQGLDMMGTLEAFSRAFQAGYREGFHRELMDR